jgi:hypothetical protein
MNTTVELNDFEAPNTFPVDVTLGDVTKRYLIREIADADVAATFNTSNAKGEQDRSRVDTFNARVIAKCVSREDGTPITYDQARAFRQPLVRALVKEILGVHGFDQDQNKTIEDAEKN